MSIVRGTRRWYHDSHRPARVIRRGLSFRAAFRYPFSPACHDWAGPTSLSVRQRSWDLAPFAVFLAYGSRRLFPPFIPTCRLPIVQHRCFLRLPAAKSELLPSESGEIRPTAKRSIFGFWVLMPQASQTEPHRAMRPVNPAMGFIVFSQVFRCARNQLDKPKSSQTYACSGHGRAEVLRRPASLHHVEQTTRRRNHLWQVCLRQFPSAHGFRDDGKGMCSCEVSRLIVRLEGDIPTVVGPSAY